MRKNRFVPLVTGALLFLTSLSAKSQCSVVGWASENGGVTGGGSATATVVNDYASLKSAITSSSVKVVHVSGAITIPAGGRISFQDQSGKTIYGLPGSKLVSNTLNKDGSGILNVRRCSNIVFRNLTFEGPGAYDTDGWDNMILDNCTNIWVDHCEFQDGMDGNLDIKNAADYISVTWCKFIYNKTPIPDGPGGSDDHRFSNLFGSGDGATGDRGKLRITMKNCWWAQGCKARMPRVRYGKVHMVNNLFNSTVAAQCVMAGFEADLLVESNVFENVGKPIDKMDNKFTAITVRNNLFTNTSKDTTGSGTAFTPPYSLPITNVNNVKSEVMAGAGATLMEDCLGVLDLSGSRTAVVLNWEPEQKNTGIYPNPSKGNITMTVALKKNERAFITIYDVQGRLVEQLPTVSSVSGGKQTINYNLQNKKSGLYNVVITGDKGLRRTYKLMVPYAFVKYVAENNVRRAIKQIREKSPILKEMEEKGEIKIVGAFYRLTDGTLEFIH